METENNAKAPQMDKETPTNQDPRLDIVRQNLRIALALRDTKAKAVSLAAGLSQNALSSFIRGETSMTFVNVLRVCDVLKIPIGLLTVEGAISPARLRLDELVRKAPPDLVLAAMAQIEKDRGGPR